VIAPRGMQGLPPPRPRPVVGPVRAGGGWRLFRGPGVPHRVGSVPLCSQRKSSQLIDKIGGSILAAPTKEK